MNITTNEVTKFILTNLDALDPINVFTEDFGKGQGQITITCFGQAWTSYWPAMGDENIKEFFCSCDEHYIAKNLSDINSETYDIDKIRNDAENKGIECWRDDPWHDYDFLSAMYGADMSDWFDSLPKKLNNEYTYLCRIIKAVKEALKNQ